MLNLFIINPNTFGTALAWTLLCGGLMLVICLIRGANKADKKAKPKQIVHNTREHVLPINDPKFARIRRSVY